MTERPDAAVQIASLPYAVVLLDPAQRVAAINSAAEQLVGQGARMLMGRPLGDILELGDPRLFAMMSESDVQINARDVVARVGRRGQRMLHIFVAPVIGWAGWQLLTLIEPAEVESLQGGDISEADETLLRAPAILAHEIKNPLAGIRGAAQLIARKLAPAHHALTALITDEVDRIAGLVDQMQSLGRKSVDPAAPVNPHLAVRRARALIEAGGPHKLTIAEEFDPSLPEAMVSQDALMQVLLNLMTNAAEACASAERPRIVLRTRFASGISLRAGEGEPPIALPIEVRVSDNGPGIDPALREQIFEPFVSSKPHGQGLGLALVRKLVRDMNGRITLDRDEEAGLTHFRLHLPMAETAAHRSALAERAS